MLNNYKETDNNGKKTKKGRKGTKHTKQPQAVDKWKELKN